MKALAPHFFFKDPTKQKKLLLASKEVKVDQKSNFVLINVKKFKLPPLFEKNSPSCQQIVTGTHAWSRSNS